MEKLVDDPDSLIDKSKNRFSRQVLLGNRTFSYHRSKDLVPTNNHRVTTDFVDQIDRFFRECDLPTPSQPR